MVLAEIGEFRVSDVTQAVADGSCQFTIENGMVLQGYPREKPDDAALTWPGEEARYVDGEIFKENAHFLFENREWGSVYRLAREADGGNVYRMVAQARERRARVLRERESVKRGEREQGHREGRFAGTVAVTRNIPEPGEGIHQCTQALHRGTEVLRSVFAPRSHHAPEEHRPKL